MRWAGSFRTSELASSAVIGSGGAAQGAAYGNITVTPVENAQGRMSVDLSINAPVAPGSQVAWAVFGGSCGSPTPPVMGPDEFPMIEVANSGSGIVRTIMALPLDPHSSYHANIYWGSQVTDVSNVMMCAKLALTGG